MGNIWAIQHHKWLEAGCVPALVFLSLFFTCVFNHIVWDLKQGVYLKYSINVSLMAINNMNEWMTYTTWGLRPRPSRGISWKHPLSTVVPSWCTRSLITSSWSTILMRCHAFYINLGKTGILLQTTPNSTAHLRSISIGETEPKKVDRGHQMFWQHHLQWWNSGQGDHSQNLQGESSSWPIASAGSEPAQHIPQSTQLKVHKTMVLTSIL